MKLFNFLCELISFRKDGSVSEECRINFVDEIFKIEKTGKILYLHTYSINFFDTLVAVL